MTYFNGNPYREKITAVAHDITFVDIKSALHYYHPGSEIQ